MDLITFSFDNLYACSGGGLLELTNRFNSATFLCLSQTMIWIFWAYIYHSLFVFNNVRSEEVLRFVDTG
jgi:hypothetical protein